MMEDLQCVMMRMLNDSVRLDNFKMRISDDDMLLDGRIVHIELHRAGVCFAVFCFDSCKCKASPGKKTTHQRP